MATISMIQGLADKLFTTLINQAQIALDFKDQFEIMRTKLELMTAFLSSTDNLKTQHKEMVQTILPNIRNLIYEADDILTDCLLTYEYRKHGSVCSSLWPHQLAFQYRTGKKLNHINSRFQEMEKTMGSFLRPELTTNRGNNAHQMVKYSSQYYDPSEIIGLEDDIEKIKGWMLRSNKEFHHVGIVGMGGLGKTTIAQKIFNDREVVAYFEKMIWVPVSQSFSEERITTIMMKQLGMEGTGLDESSKLPQIRRILRQKKCLVVMDDVWRKDLDWWKNFCGESSFSIITSRNEDVVKRMGVDNSRIHRPRTLNEKESWLLFCKFAFSRSRGQCSNDQLERVGRDILERCGGLPLAIKTIAALLAPKVDSLKEWKKIYQDFHGLTTTGQNSSVMASLQMSYDELPTHLKPCLLCFSIYPEDFKVHGEQIVHWWVAEGIVQGKNPWTATELGYEYLSELANRCLLDVVNRRNYDGRVYSCKVHDLTRDMVIKIANDEAFCSFDGQGKQKQAEDSRWLGFTTDMNPKLLKNCSKLRALLLMSNHHVSYDMNLKLLKSLRVLDFSNNKLDTIEVERLWSWICSLKRLAHLNLSGVQSLKEVPYSVQKLRNLQILVLRKCKNLAKLDPSVTNLKKLIVLDLSFCNLKCLPNGLEKLVHLQELSGFRVESRANSRRSQLRELRSLTELRVLRLSINFLSEMANDEWNVFSNLTNLKVLAIDAENCKNKSIQKMLDHLSAPPSLEHLFLEHYRHEILPKWINPKQLPNLQYLCLEDGDINHLPMSVNDETEDSSISKWTLEGLRLMFLPNLVLDWQNLGKDMPFLHHAEVSHCFNLENFPFDPDKLAVWTKNQD
ncbi:disease resistance RPP13-like protein 4 [Pistacia vera]|uniref:disease resistance RPP13-like protein 4 n=1 Tax=Pistacia vera TaxID=55513 RepID=UPI001263281E|nr:disease resistance RPP13-like protein 4 [Pistacia vera]